MIFLIVTPTSYVCRCAYGSIIFSKRIENLTNSRCMSLLAIYGRSRNARNSSYVNQDHSGAAAYPRTTYGAIASYPMSCA